MTNPLFLRLEEYVFTAAQPSRSCSLICTRPSRRIAQMGRRGERFSPRLRRKARCAHRHFPPVTDYRHYRRFGKLTETPAVCSSQIRLALIGWRPRIFRWPSSCCRIWRPRCLRREIMRWVVRSKQLFSRESFDPTRRISPVCALSSARSADGQFLQSRIGAREDADPQLYALYSRGCLVGPAACPFRRSYSFRGQVEVRPPSRQGGQFASRAFQ